MKNEKLLDAFGKIDDDLIVGALNDTAISKRNIWLKFGSMAAVLVLLIGVGILSIRNWNNHAVANSIIILDVNPSISLTVNENEKIVTAEGLNEDGNIVLSGMELVGVDMEVAVNAIIGSMLQKGYLSELQNTILISVENSDIKKSSELQERVSSMVGNIFQGSSLDGSVLSQSISSTAELEQMAQEFNISLGKAALIQEVVAQDSTLSIEKLTPLSITEIALISQTKNLIPEAVTQYGDASVKAYISWEAAIEIAYRHAGVNAEDVADVKTEFDIENETVIYEIDFYVGTTEYEYGIDARTGQVLEYEISGKPENSKGQSIGESTTDPTVPIGNDTTSPTAPIGNDVTSPTTSIGNNTPTPAALIGEEMAKSAALSHAGLTASQAKKLKVEFDVENGISVYEVEFEYNDYEYDYEIDAVTGDVISHKLEIAEGNVAPTTPIDDNTKNPASLIGEEAAKSAALSHAGLTASQVKKLKAEFDKENGIAVYEVEFEYNGYEYDYEIDAATGDVISYKSEIEEGSVAPTAPVGENATNPTTPINDNTKNPASLIGEDAAKSAALSHAGLTASQVKKLKVEFDRDDGISIYEIEFAFNGYEYDYEIDATTGDVISYKSEIKEGSIPETNTGNTDPTAPIGEDAAKSAALSHAGLTASQVKKLKVEFDRDDGIAIYEVEFEYNGYEYEYEIDAATGEIREYKIDD